MQRIELQQISKRYPGCVANDAVSLTVASGEIHALLGENGAGKSTLMKIIYGVVKPDQGQVIWEGQAMTVRGPAHARKLGIGMVFQHFSLFETLTVAENIALSLPKSDSRSLPQLKQRIVQVSQQYGMKLDPNRYIHSLSIGEQQRVEIVRCLLQDVKLLILDEPTSVLTPQEVEGLFKILLQLAAEGCSILFISHKLDEVRALCDQATILRAGKVQGSCVPKDVSNDELARMMVGDDTPLAEAYHKVSGGETVLHVSQLNYQSPDPFSCRLKNISLELKAGEILGIAGVAGNGQEELLNLVSGEYCCDPDTIKFLGAPVGDQGPQQRRALGMGVVPEERLGRGAVPNMSLENNALLTAYQSGLANRGWINMARVRDYTAAVIKGFNVKAAGGKAQAQSLSGGNLQKFIIGREILQQPKVLVCSHPTWGVDIGAAILIRYALIDLRDQGAAILVVSEDIDELYAISDRVGAICDGQISPIAATSEVSIQQLGAWMAGEFEPQSSVSATNLEEVAG